jgi:HK97 family phage prohead protease
MGKGCEQMPKVNLQFFAEAAQQLDHEEKGYLDFDAEFKVNAEEKGVIEGYASTYGNLDRQNDILMPGAFKAASGKRFPIFALHDPSKALGVGVVTEDEKGLKVKMKLEVDNADSDTLRERAKEFYAMAKTGIIQKMSVGFITQEKEWETRKEADGRERYIRKIIKGELLEISLVPIPANPKASITTVKQQEQPDKLVQLEARIKELEAKLATAQPGDNATPPANPEASAEENPATDGKEGENEETKAKGEQEFISACMRRLKNKFPDPKQRLAVCYSELENGKDQEIEEQKTEQQEQTTEKSLSCEYLIAAKLGLF